MQQLWHRHRPQCCLLNLGVSTDHGVVTGRGPFSDAGEEGCPQTPCEARSEGGALTSSSNASKWCRCSQCSLAVVIRALAACPDTDRSSRQLQLQAKKAAPKNLFSQAKKAATKNPLSQAKRAATQVTEPLRGSPSRPTPWLHVGTNVLRAGHRMPAASLERKSTALDSAGNRSNHQMLQNVCACCKASTPGHANSGSHVQALFAARSNLTCSATACRLRIDANAPSIDSRVSLASVAIRLLSTFMQVKRAAPSKPKPVRQVQSAANRASKGSKGWLGGVSGPKGLDQWYGEAHSRPLALTPARQRCFSEILFRRHSSVVEPMYWRPGQQGGAGAGCLRELLGDNVIGCLTRATLEAVAQSELRHP